MVKKASKPYKELIGLFFIGGLFFFCKHMIDADRSSRTHTHSIIVSIIHAFTSIYICLHDMIITLQTDERTAVERNRYMTRLRHTKIETSD